MWIEMSTPQSLGPDQQVPTVPGHTGIGFSRFVPTTGAPPEALAPGAHVGKWPAHPQGRGSSEETKYYSRLLMYWIL